MTPLTLVSRSGGGQGGHSGTGIALGRSNALKVLGRALREADSTVAFRLVSFDGGKSRNAIPRDATAVVSVTSTEEAAFRTAIDVASRTIRDAFSKTDPGLSIEVSAADGSTEPWTAEATDASARRRRDRADRPARNEP